MQPTTTTPPVNAALPVVAKVLRIPSSYYYYHRCEDDDRHQQARKKPPPPRINPHTPSLPNTVPSLADALVYFPSLFLREFVSTICVLVLNSRLSSDLFIASPVVSLYVNIVFRRPLNSPYVTTLACLSASDWRKANVAGYPGFNKDKTRWWELALFWAWLVAAELCGAAAAAAIRAHNDRVLGYEFVKGAAWGVGQMFLRANVQDSETCWNSEYFGPGSKTVDIPIRLFRNDTDRMLQSASCIADIRWRWWFAEDLGAVLFIVVAYVHIWRWLRWDDMEMSNPHDREMRYWQKIVTFSIATASVGAMTTIAFPTANAGLHTSLFLGVYQSLNADKNVASTALNEPLLRAFGGTCGCLLGVAYEWGLAWLDTKERGQSELADAAHKMLYNGAIPAGVEEKKKGAAEPKAGHVQC